MKPKNQNTTTIQLHRTTLSKLDNYRNRDDKGYDATIDRALTEIRSLRAKLGRK